jgi:4-hydroxy-tetrahydrodipicolinate synthase
MKLRGPFVPLITPFKHNLKLDLDGFRKNVRFILGNGIRASQGVLMAAVAAGEFPSLTLEERKALARALVDEARGKAPLVIAAQHTDPRVAIELCRYAEGLGIDAVQISPTYYDPGQTDDDVIRFYKLVASHTEVGFIVYNTYWQGYNHTVRVMPKLLGVRNVIAMKWSAPTEWQYRQMLRFYGDRLVFVDNMNLHVWSHMHGGLGFLSHVGNFWPEHELLIWRLLNERRYEEANDELLRLNYPFYDLIGAIAESTGIVDSNVTKAAVELVGLSGGPVRPPARDLTKKERGELLRIMKKAGVPFRRAK